MYDILTSNINNLLPGLTPDHHCKINDTYNVSGAIALIEDDGKTKLSKCFMYDMNTTTTNATIGCGKGGWQYESKEGIVAEVRRFKCIILETIIIMVLFDRIVNYKRLLPFCLM